MTEIKSEVFGDLQNNCYILTDKETGESALIDCTEDSEKMFSFIDGTSLKYILLTHGHFDHIGGVAAVKEKYGCQVVISQQDSPMTLSSKASLAAYCGLNQSNFTANITVNDGDIITLGNTRIKVMATPGHTKGGVCYIADDNIFTGDTLFFCSCGRTDFPGGSSAEIMQSLKKIASLKGNYNIYPGHDRISTLDFERKNNPYMK